VASSSVLSEWCSKEDFPLAEEGATSKSPRIPRRRVAHPVHVCGLWPVWNIYRGGMYLYMPSLMHGPLADHVQYLSHVL